MHLVSGLIQCIELFAEAIKMFGRIGGRGDVGLRRSQTVPVGDLVVHHAIAGERELRGDGRVGECLSELQSVRDICHRQNRAKII